MSGDYVKVFTKGLQSALESTSIENGKLRFTVDSGRLYLDHNTSRIAISGVVTGFTDSEIRNLSTPLPKLYVASDTLKLYASDGTDMVDLTGLVGDPVSTLADAYQYIWISDLDEGGPKYSEELAYNPSTQSLKAGCFQIDNTHQQNLAIGDLDFDDPSGDDDGEYNFGDIEEYDETATVDADFGDQDVDTFDIFAI